MKFEDLMASKTLIPSLPATVALIFGEFQKPEPQIRQITHLVSSEVGLTVRVLRLLNSARYGSGGRIGTMEAAIPLLGLNATKQLVSAAAVGGAFRAVEGVNMPEFWRHSLDVAKIAQSLAASMGHDKGLAFTAGLLHGVGDLVMKMAMPTTGGSQPPRETLRMFAARKASSIARKLPNSPPALPHPQWRAVTTAASSEVIIISPLTTIP